MRKGLTVVLTVLMLLACCTGVTAAGFGDTAGLQCETAVQVLSGLGIVEGKEAGVYAPEDTLTRAEMTTIILRLLKMEGKAAGTDAFTDVPKSHWAYANIAAAKQMGIVNGTSETNFSPDEPVTYEQAVKMVVATLGYTVQAEAMGGYPSGYLSKAQQLNLLSGVQTGGEMNRGNMAVLVYNALDKEMFIKTSYGEEAYTFAADETKTLLSVYLKMQKTVDAVTASPMAKLTVPSRRLLADEVAVGDAAVIMKAGETGAESLLGIRSEIYYYTEAGTDVPQIAVIVPRPGTEVLDLRAQDVVQVSGGRLVYTDNEGRDREAAVGGARVLVNGKLVATPAEADFKPAIGTVRLIANGGGKDYELAIVESYENHVVKSVNMEESRVTFKDNTQMVLDLSDNAIATVITDPAGKALTLDDLQEWDVVSVAQDDALNPTMRRIYRSYTMASGAITEISDDTVLIGETSYPIAPSLDRSLLGLGQSAGYYLDFTGAVAAVDKSYEKRYTYGWLRYAEYSKGIEAVPQMKIFAEDGKWIVLSLADTVEFNGTAVPNKAVMEKDAFEGDAVYTDGHAPMLFDKNGTFIPQLIAYNVNSDGEIDEMHTAQNLTNPSVYGTDKDEIKLGNAFSMDWYTNSQNGAYNGGWISRFNNQPLGENRTSHTECAGGVLFGRVFISSAKMFIIPMEADNEELYKMRDISTYGLESHRATKCISYYDVDENYNCGAIVVRNDIANTGTEDAYPSYTVASAIITGKSTVLNQDGEAVLALKMRNYNGKEVTATIEDPEFKCLYRYANADLTKDPDWYVEFNDGTVSSDPAKVTNRTAKAGANRMYLDAKDLDPGDIVMYQLDDFGNLTMANVCFRANYGGGVEFTFTESNGLLVTAKENYYRGGTLQVHGNVDEIYTKGIFVNVNIADSLGRQTNVTAVHAMKKSGVFYMWDKEKETLRTITADDVMPGDEVFVLFATTSQRMMVVYRPTAPDVYIKKTQ